MNWFNKILIATFLIVAAILWVSCETLTPPNPNRPPSTKMANVPMEGDTIFPLATLNWTGGDFDGYVKGFQYKITTYHLASGSTTNWLEFASTQWFDTTASSITIPFNSSDLLNKQIFTVRAIDNEGALDPNPAIRSFVTTRASPPKTTILFPKKTDTLLAVQNITDWWTGVNFRFKAVDQTVGGAIAEYAYSVDGGSWIWVDSPNVWIDPNQFAKPLSGRHYIKATARNNTNLIDQIGDSVSFVIVEPTFDKKILLIDETDEEKNPPFITQNIKDSTVDNFYLEVFPGADLWDFKKQGMPPRYILAQYKLVVWYADDNPASVPHKIADSVNISIFTDYLLVGGKFIMGGWGILKSFAYRENFPFAYKSGNFVYDILHIKTVDVTNLYVGDMISGTSSLFKDTLEVDSLKLVGFPYYGKLAGINLILSTAGFTDGLYRYNNANNSSYVSYRGRTIALRYYGTVYDAVVLGFPLYFMKKDDAIRFGQKVLQSLDIQ